MKSSTPVLATVNSPEVPPQRLGTHGTMAVRHYKRRRAGDDIGIAGCACRGCTWYRIAAPKRNAHVAEPFRSFINSISGGTA